MIVPENVLKIEDSSLNEESGPEYTARDTFINVKDQEYWYDPNLIKDVTAGVQRKLFIIVFICSAFIVVEAIGAVLSSSIAIFTDVAHLLSDLIGFILSLVSVALSRKKSNALYSFGYVRAEVIGALFSLVIIWALTIWIIKEAVDRIVNKEYDDVKPHIMLVTSIIGLGVNLLMGFTLHGHGGHHHHGHDHGHDHGHNHGHDHKHDHHDHEDDHHGHDHHGHDHHDHEHGKGHKHGHKLHKHGKEHKSKTALPTSDKLKGANRMPADEESGLGNQPPKFQESISNIEQRIKDDINATINTQKAKTDLVRDQNSYQLGTDETNRITDQLPDQYFKKATTLARVASDKKEPLLVPENTRSELNLSVVEVESSHNIRAAWMHILGDTIQSLGVILVATLIFFRNDWKILDPILSITFSILAVSFSIPVMRDVLKVMMDTTPQELDYHEFQKDLCMIKHVTDVHDLHIWLLTHGKPSLTAHIKCSEEPEYVLKKATIICRKMGIYHTTIQVELDKTKTRYPINCGHNVHK